MSEHESETIPMTRTEALKHVNTMLHAVQRIRSTTVENTNWMWDHDPRLPEADRLNPKARDRVRADLYPWVFGEKCILPLLADVSMGKKVLNGSGFLNLMTIAHTLEPVIEFYAASFGLGELPEPRLEWVAGFKEEA